MVYVHRNSSGEIDCLFANPQPQEDGSFLNDPEPLSDDAAEVAEFLKSIEQPSSGPTVADLQSQLDALTAQLAAKNVISATVIAEPKIA